MMWLFWRLIPHSHGADDMEYLGMYYPGDYEIWRCPKCHFTEAL